MSVSVVGLDIGSFSSYVVVAKQGGVDSLVNEYSDRNTPTCISFNEKVRLIGHEAKQQQISNVKNTICNFNRYIGKTISDSIVVDSLKRQLCKVVKTDDGRVGFQVNYLRDRYIFNAEQVYAMQLSKLKEIAEINLKANVVDVVINVPTNATDSERRAIFDASRMANLNCIRIINDTTSSALAYGFYRQDLPEVNDKPRIVAIIDMGYSNLQSALVALNKGKMKVIVTSCDNIGGRDLDEIIYNHIKLDFKERYNLIVEDDKKSGVRLMQECEKLKKLMSVNSTPIPLNIECFINDVDVSTKMLRCEFEKLSSSILGRVRMTLDKLLRDGNLTPNQVDAVEIVGGCTRVPAVKDIISYVFKQEVRTSLNSDEAVAKGCAIQCAILSPALLAKEFIISDVCMYPIFLSYEDVKGKELVEIFSQWHPFPTSQQMIFFRNKSFNLEAMYGDGVDLPIRNRTIGIYNVSGVSEGQNKESTRVTVKMRVNANGIFTCCQAQRLETIVNGDGISDTESPRNIDLPMRAIILQYTPAKIKEFRELESQMITQVTLEKERSLAKNHLEELVYEMRNKLYGDLESFICESERDRLLNVLTVTENWLYDDGVDVAKQLYVDHYKELRKICDIFVIRAQETENRPLAAEEFGRVCVKIQKVISGIDEKEETYNYLGAEDREVLAKVLAIERAWFSAVMIRQKSQAAYEDPVVTAAEIHTHREALEMVAYPIIDRVTQSTHLSSLTDIETRTPTSVHSDSSPLQQSSDMDLD